jgi:hypothetical protein
VAADLKRIYTATTADEAEQRLAEFEACGRWLTLPPSPAPPEHRRWC